MEPFDFYYRKIRSSFSQLQERRNHSFALAIGKESKEETKERHEGTEKRRNVMKERRNEGTSQGREERKNKEETEEPEENMCK